MTKIEQLTKQITELQATVDSLAEEEFSMEGKKYVCHGEGDISDYACDTYINKFNAWATREIAQRVAKEQIAINFIKNFAYHEDAKTCWVPDWNSRIQTKYSVYFDYEFNGWEIDSIIQLKDQSVYMSKDTANKLKEYLKKHYPDGEIK